MRPNSETIEAGLAALVAGLRQRHPGAVIEVVKDERQEAA